jgi:peptide-methionine (S)-S-oxide reductase
MLLSRAPRWSVAAASVVLSLLVSARGLGAQSTSATETAVFAGGCFWGIEAVFDHTKGVVSAVSGYAGGTMPHPSYEQVSTETTGYAESVRVTYDSSQVSYRQLLKIFFAVHDPTELNRQGPDVGPSYRSAVFYANDQQRLAAAAYIAQLTTERRFSRKIATSLEPLTTFYEAEAYHQHYLEHHRYQPHIVINDLPKLRLLKRRFPQLWRDGPAS